MKYLTIALVAVTLLFIPTPAYACSGWIDCWLGISSTVEIRQTQQTERERIAAERDADIARIQGEADTRIKQAEAEVERVKQQQYQSEADRDIAIAQANAKAEEYKAMIAGLTSEKIAGIQSNADTQIAALQAQAQIAIEGIVQTGRTERWRVAFGWATLIVGLLVVGMGWLYWLRRNAPQVVVMLPKTPTAQRLPWYDEQLEIVEVKNANALTRQN